MPDTPQRRGAMHPHLPGRRMVEMCGKIGEACDVFKPPQEGMCAGARKDLVLALNPSHAFRTPRQAQVQWPTGTQRRLKSSGRSNLGDKREAFQAGHLSGDNGSGVPVPFCAGEARSNGAGPNPSPWGRFHSCPENWVGWFAFFLPFCYQTEKQRAVPALSLMEFRGLAWATWLPPSHETRSFRPKSPFWRWASWTCCTPSAWRGVFRGRMGRP